MERQELIRKFQQNHQALVEYICSLRDADFMINRNEKWSPGQQLDHVVKCIVPLAKALGNKAFVEAKFGKVQRPVLSYDEVIKNYKHGLGNGGKAPERFLPEQVELAKREALEAELMQLLDTLVKSLDNYSEDELDSLALPHPFLGNLTIREMLYLMSYHAVHHRERTEENLKS